jgi:hypothetical protein
MIKAEYRVRCDFCNYDGMGTTSHDARTAHIEAARQGWKRKTKDGALKDYCPRCAAELLTKK